MIKDLKISQIRNDSRGNMLCVKHSGTAPSKPQGVPLRLQRDRRNSPRNTHRLLLGAGNIFSLEKTVTEQVKMVTW